MLGVVFVVAFVIAALVAAVQPHASLPSCDTSNINGMVEDEMMKTGMFGDVSVNNGDSIDITVSLSPLGEESYANGQLMQVLFAGPRTIYEIAPCAYKENKAVGILIDFGNSYVLYSYPMSATVAHMEESVYKTKSGLW